MKQLTIFCSDDLEGRVITALDRVGVESFLQLGGATGNKFSPAGEVPRTMSWDATVFLVPGAADDQVAAIADALETYAAACATKPCLRIVVSAIDRLY